MDVPHHRRFTAPVGLGLLLALAACEQSCNWTDPEPGPLMRAHELEVPYESEAGDFTVIVHADEDAWPPVVGPSRFAVEVTSSDPDATSSPSVQAYVPYHSERDLVSPRSVRLERMDEGGGTISWWKSTVELPVAGVWVVPFEIQGQETSDVFELRIETIE